MTADAVIAADFLGSPVADHSRRVYASGKAALDPMELLPPGTFGRELAMAALARLLDTVG